MLHERDSKQSQVRTQRCLTYLVVLVSSDYDSDELGPKPSLWRESAGIGVEVLKVGSHDDLMGGEEVGAAMPQVSNSTVVGIQRNKIREDPPHTCQSQPFGNLCKDMTGKDHDPASVTCLTLYNDNNGEGGTG